MGPSSICHVRLDVLTAFPGTFSGRPMHSGTVSPLPASGVPS
ncbi:hypothetical protein [Azospirillum sp. INR13]|nr:hypothetical protein [Azospirillum sp. INR13]